MTDQEILAHYVELAEFMSLCFSEDVEVLVHDASRPDRSTIAVFNGHISGREIGAPLPELGRRFMTEEIYQGKKWVVNYKGVTDKGVVVRSSTYFIRNARGKSIGALCLNVDIRKYETLRHLVGSMIDPASAADSRKETEFLNTTIGWQINQALADYCTQNGRYADELTKNDRIEILRELARQDFFDRKGAISEAAERLNISEPSVYRYLKGIKRES